MKRFLVIVAVAASAVGSAAGQLVFPPLPQAAQNFIPFGVGTTTAPVNSSTQHQVFRAAMFGSSPVTISRVAFSPGVLGVYNGSVTIRFGYTTRTPGVAGPVGLDVPAGGGGGSPNATGAMTTFFTDPTYSKNITVIGTEAWNELAFNGTFNYDPALGNLLMEIVAVATLGQGTDLTVSRSNGSTDSSRSYTTTRFGDAALGTTATRVKFFFGGAPAGCYPDCNGDGALNLSDFGCFQTKFALGCP